MRRYYKALLVVFTGLVWTLTYFLTSNGQLLRNVYADTKKVTTVTEFLISESIIETEMDFMDRMHSRMKARREVMEKACRKMSTSGQSKGNIQLIPANKYRLVYCPVPKVGCSNMKRVMLALNGYGNDTNQIFPQGVYGQNALLHAEVLQNFQMKTKGIPTSMTMQNYTKFLVVRHPFERALSGYKNKLAMQYGNKVPQYFELSKAIRRKYGGTKADNTTPNGTASFHNFVDYLYDSRDTMSLSTNDVHWIPAHQLCSPCENQYDVVAKLETIEEDQRYLMKIIGAPIGLKMPMGYSKTKGSRVDSSVTEKFIKSLPVDKLTKLYEVYKTDFEIFNYQSIA